MIFEITKIDPVLCRIGSKESIFYLKITLHFQLLMYCREVGRIFGVDYPCFNVGCEGKKNRGVESAREAKSPRPHSAVLTNIRQLKSPPPVPSEPHQKWCGSATHCLQYVTFIFVVQRTSGQLVQAAPGRRTGILWQRHRKQDSGSLAAIRTTIFCWNFVISPLIELSYERLNFLSSIRFGYGSRVFENRRTVPALQVHRVP
jgi:hypothetical protein